MGEVRDRFRRANRRQRIAAKQQLKALGDYLKATAVIATFLASWPVARVVAVWRWSGWRSARASALATWKWLVRSFQLFMQRMKSVWSAVAKALKPHQFRILIAVLVLSIVVLISGALAIAYLLHSVWEISPPARTAAALMLVVIVGAGFVLVLVTRLRQISESSSKALQIAKSWLSAKARSLSQLRKKRRSVSGFLATIRVQLTELARRAVAKFVKALSAVRLPFWKRTVVASSSGEIADVIEDTHFASGIRRDTSDDVRGWGQSRQQSHEGQVSDAPVNPRGPVANQESTNSSIEAVGDNSFERDDGSSIGLIEVSLFSAFELSFCVISIAMISLFSVLSISGGSFSVLPDVGVPGNSNPPEDGDATDSENGIGTEQPSQSTPDLGAVDEEKSAEAATDPKLADEVMDTLSSGVFDLIRTPIYWRSNSAFEFRNASGAPVEFDDARIDYSKLCSANVIVSVGIASKDGSSLWNFDRAQRRARSIAQVAATALERCGAVVPIVLDVRGEAFIPSNSRDGRRAMLLGVFDEESSKSSVLLDAMLDKVLLRELRAQASPEADLVSERCLFLLTDKSRSLPALKEMKICRSL